MGKDDCEVSILKPSPKQRPVDDTPRVLDQFQFSAEVTMDAASEATPNVLEERASSGSAVLDVKQMSCTRRKLAPTEEPQFWLQVCLLGALSFSLSLSHACSRQRIHTHIPNGPIVLKCQRVLEKTLSLSLSRTLTLAFFLSLLRAHSFFLSFSGSVSEVGLFNFKNSASTSSTRKRTCSLCACSLATNCEHSFFRRYCQAL
jgi:hypothetical protein